MSSSASWLPSFLDPTTASEVLAYTAAAAATQLGQLTKTRQKLDWKIWEIDGSCLCLHQFHKILSMSKYVLPKNREITSSYLIFGSRAI